MPPFGKQQTTSRAQQHGGGAVGECERLAAHQHERHVKDDENAPTDHLEQPI